MILSTNRFLRLLGNASPSCQLQQPTVLREGGLNLMPFGNLEMDVPSGQIFIEFPKGIRLKPQEPELKRIPIFRVPESLTAESDRVLQV